MHTILTLTTQSLLPGESILFLKETLKTNDDKLTNDEVLALVTAHQEDWVANKQLQALLDKPAFDVNKILSGLVEVHLLQTFGQGRGTKYKLSDKFYDTEESIDIGDKEVGFGDSGFNIGVRVLALGVQLLT